MRRNTITVALMALALLPAAANAQFPRPGFPTPGLPGGGGFQSGIGRGGFMGLLPGSSGTLVAYCGDLFAAAPDASTQLLPDPGTGEVVAGGQILALRDAIDHGVIAVRGHSALVDGPAQPGQSWLDFHIVNLVSYPVSVKVDPGTVFTPVGQARPKVSPRIGAMLAEEERSGLAETGAASMAMWASQGFTARDVAETTFGFLSPTSVQTVQRLLDTAGIARKFDSGSDPYGGIYRAKLAALGAGARALRLPLTLASGAQAMGLLTRNAAGDAVIDVTVPGKPDAGHLYYSAKVLDTDGGKFAVTLYQPETGRPLEDVAPLRYKLPAVNAKQPK